MRLDRSYFFSIVGQLVLVATSAIAFGQVPPVFDSLKDQSKKMGIKPSLVEDIIAAIKAEDAEREKKLDLAAKRWLSALDKAPDGFGTIALNGWMRVQLKLKGNLSVVDLAALLFKQTRDGRGNRFLVREKLVSLVKLQSYLRTIAAEDVQKNFAEGERAGPAIKSGIPLHDPLLDAVSQRFCKSQRTLTPDWRAWLDTLAKPVRTYWLGLAAACSGEGERSIALLTEALPLLTKTRATEPLAILGYQTLMRMYRFNAKREMAAEAVAPLLALWKQPSVTPASLGISEPEFKIRLVDDYLWAARHKALVGDYKSATYYASEGQRMIGDLRRNKRMVSGILVHLSDSEAESYYVLAHRIYVENKQYTLAAKMAQSGLLVPNLTREWRERFLWSAGFYAYLGEKNKEAVTRWAELLSLPGLGFYEPKVLYWLGRIHIEMGKQDAAKNFLDSLERKYPLDFYNVIAQTNLRTPPEPTAGEAFFSQPTRLLARLNQIKRDADALFKSRPDLRPLYLRALVLSKIGRNDWAQPIGQSLRRAAARVGRVTHDRRLFLGLCWLLDQLGMYPDSIAVAEQIRSSVPGIWKENPELILLYYPRAYADIYREEARASGLQPEFLWAISRQESLFNKSARSFADARGLMQLIVPTAAKVARESNRSVPTSAEELYEPKVNVGLGSLLIKKLADRYFQDYSAMSAAYNAGEYAVDTWRLRRANPDPMIWLELIPYGETHRYVLSIWRNLFIYSLLEGTTKSLSLRPQMPILKISSENSAKK